MKPLISIALLILFQSQLFSQCVVPSSVHIETFDYEFPNITWTENGSATTWDIEYGLTGFTPTGSPTEANLTETHFSIYELDNTTYDFYVRSNCGTEQSDWVGPFTFYNYCEGYAETGFDDAFLPACWSQANQGTPTDEPQHFGFGTWQQSNFANTGSNLAAKIHIQGTDVHDWLLSPLLIKYYPLKAEWYEIYFNFNIALTQHNTTDAAVLGSDDQVQLVYSLDYGNTWNELQTWDNHSSISNTGDFYTLNITGHSDSKWLLIAFWASSGVINDAEDIDFFIDDVSIWFQGPGSVTDLKAKGFSYAPNPAQNTLSLSAKEPINAFVLYDVFGRKIQGQKIDSFQKQIDISKLTKGMYYLQVEIGNTVGMVKVIKQ